MGDERLLGISIADNLLFAQTSLTNLYTYDAESGQLLWSASFGKRMNEARDIAANSRLVFVAGFTYLYALDRRTGRTVWRVELPAQPSSPTGADENRAMIGLASGKLMAFDVANGSPVWNWQTGGPILARPIPAIQLAAFASQDGKAYVALVDPVTMLYRFAAGGPISASMGTFGTRTLLIPSEDRNLYAIDLFTAETKWTFPSGAPILHEPLVANSDVYVANTQGQLSVLDAESGVPRWTTSTHGGRLLAVGAKRIYFKSSDGDLFIVDRATGQTVADPRSTRDRSGVRPARVRPERHQSPERPPLLRHLLGPGARHPRDRPGPAAACSATPRRRRSASSRPRAIPTRPPHRPTAERGPGRCERPARRRGCRRPPVMSAGIPLAPLHPRGAGGAGASDDATHETDRRAPASSR